MRKSGAGSHQILFAIAHAPIVFAPRHLARLGHQIWTGDVMVNADFRAAQAGEKRLRLIGVGLVRRMASELLIRLVKERTCSASQCEALSAER